jgi:hypothetical protein
MYITYMNQHVFAPLGIPTSACKPAGTSEILFYPLPPGSTQGWDGGDWSAKCGSGGWVLKASDVFKVINDLATGNVLLTNPEKSQMTSNCLGWDCSVRPDCPNPYVCKNGDLSETNNGKGIAVWTYAGIFKGNVPVVVYVNSFLPSPYQPYDSNGNTILCSSACTPVGVETGTCVPCPAGQACGKDIIGLVMDAYKNAAPECVPLGRPCTVPGAFCCGLGSECSGGFCASFRPPEGCNGLPVPPTPCSAQWHCCGKDGWVCGLCR